MVQDRTTPEKKLLELIESPTGNTLRQIKTRRKRIGLISLGAFKGRFSFLKSWFTKGFARHRFVLDFKELNIILTVCVVVLIVYLAISWFDVTGKSAQIVDFTSELAAKEQIQTFSPASLLKDFSYYSQRVKSRNIFELDLKTISSQAEEDEIVEEKVVTPKDELLELMESLVLVGVSWSEDPIAMIEDTDAKMTYFLKKDKEIDKGVKIKQIFIDKVILEYKGAEVELKL